MSVDRKKEKTSEEKRSVETLDPTAKGGLDFLINQAQGLADNPLVAPLSDGTLSAINAVGTGASGVNEAALSTLTDAAGGGFVDRDPAILKRVSDFVGTRAARSVNDVFTAGGRTGSPAQAGAISEAVTNAISPFAFQFEAGELARQDAEQAQRISSALGLQGIQSQEDAALLSRQIAQLQANGIIDEQQARELEEPFRRLGLLSDTIVPAAGLGPKTIDQTGTAKSSSGGFSLDII